MTASADLTRQELYLLFILIENELLPNRPSRSPLIEQLEGIHQKLRRELGDLALKGS
jgi:hypothetical protein